MTDRPKVLLVFFSRSGTTAEVAHLIADELECDIEELKESRDRSGGWGYVRSALGAVLGLRSALRPLARDPADYDLVVIGTPVWSGSVSTPVRTYLARQRGRFHRVGFFLTHSSTGRDRVFRQMAELAGAMPVGTLAVSAHDRCWGDGAYMAEQFTRMLRAFVPVLPVTPPRASQPRVLEQLVG